MDPVHDSSTDMSYSSPVRTLVTQPWWDEIKPVQNSKPSTHSTGAGTPRDQSLAQSKWAPKHGKLVITSTAADNAPGANQSLTKNDYADSDMVDAVDNTVYWGLGATPKAPAKPFSLSPTAPSFEIPTASLEIPIAPALEAPTASSDTWELDEDGDAVMTDLEGIAVIKGVADTIAGERKEARTRSSEVSSPVPPHVLVWLQLAMLTNRLGTIYGSWTTHQ